MLSHCQNLNRLMGNRGRLHSAHWLASSLKLAVRCPVSGCWPSCLVWGTAANFSGFRVLASLLETNQNLHDV